MKSCESTISIKLEKLRDRIQSELRYINEISRDLKEFPSNPSLISKSNDCGSSPKNDTVDPDVWPPPTPAGGRLEPKRDDNKLPFQQNENLPAWARGRENDVKRQQLQIAQVAPQFKRPADYARRGGAEENNRAAAMKKERDNIPSSRRRQVESRPFYSDVIVSC